MLLKLRMKKLDYGPWHGSWYSHFFLFCSWNVVPSTFQSSRFWTVTAGNSHIEYSHDHTCNRVPLFFNPLCFWQHATLFPGEDLAVRFVAFSGLELTVFGSIFLIYKLRDLNCKFLFSCKTSDRCLIPNLARANSKELISSTNHYQKSISLSQENSNLLGYPSLPIIWTETAKFENTCLFSIVCWNVANSYAAYNTKIMITVTMCYPAPWKKKSDLELL